MLVLLAVNVKTDKIKNNQECQRANAVLTLLRINAECRQKYICISIARNPGEFYTNFMPLT